jgi:NADPH-dependent 2,4-dienoyl-CoA reductase/sulfur reductase-like enzyme
MTHDAVVIGAGPAGMAAAATTARLGLKTLLLDEQPRVGGQIYRNLEGTTSSVASLLGEDYTGGRALVDDLRASGAEVRHSAFVWDVSQDLCVTGVADGRTFQVRPRELIAAVGAMERASPLPGWTLPGVMNAGAAQIAMKSDGVVPVGPVVLAGSGPLLLQVACQLVDAGSEVAALVETTSARARIDAIRHLPRALRAPAYLLKGAKMLMRLRAAGVRRYAGATDLRVDGTDSATALRFSRGSARHVIAADLLLLHHGVITNTQLSRLLRVEHAWSKAQQCWNVVCDPYGQTSLPGFRVAGDGAAIAGALAARESGALAALGAAHALGRLDALEVRRRSAPHLRKLASHQAIRPFLDALYRPPEFISNPPDETIVCRCEEVTAGRIREMARLGCRGPNQTKFFSRCGMGPCQGRICGTPVTQILARTLSALPSEVGAYRVRSPLKPVPLSVIAALHLQETTSAEEPRAPWT